MFILGGAVLLSVQYMLVQQLLASSIATISAGCIDDAEWVDIGDPTPTEMAVECSDGFGGINADAAQNVVWELTIQQTDYLSQEVLSGMLLWSVVILVAFAGLAVLAARWLSQRSLGRIAHITATTREIAHADLGRRLRLPGPVDEVKELGDTIDGMLDRLDDAFTRQERFVAAASHELRTPLTTTRTALEIPLEHGRFPTEVEPDVRRALAANERSERLIASLLTLARGTSDPDPADGRPVDLTALVRETLTECETEPNDRGIRPIVAGNTVFAATDATMTEMLIGNLVVNAIRYNVDGGHLRVELTTTDAGAKGRIVNDGREYTEAEVARFTEPFHRGEQTRLSGTGTGLGLALAETLARRMRGTLTLRPRTGGGLEAEFTLPAG